jgi:hypothetical protein
LGWTCGVKGLDELAKNQVDSPRNGMEIWGFLLGGRIGYTSNVIHTFACKMEEKSSLMGKVCGFIL